MCDSSRHVSHIERSQVLDDFLGYTQLRELPLELQEVAERESAELLAEQLRDFAAEPPIVEPPAEPAAEPAPEELFALRRQMIAEAAALKAQIEALEQEHMAKMARIAEVGSQLKRALEDENDRLESCKLRRLQ